MSDSDASGPGGTETRILDAAGRLIVHYGYDKTTIDDIARAAGVSKSTIYARWKNKDTLLEAILWHEGQRYTAEWLAQVEADPEGGTFHSIYRHALAVLKDNPVMAAIMRRDRRMLGTYLKRANVENLFKQRLVLLRWFLKGLQDAGTVRQDVDVDVVAYAANCMSYGFLMMGDVIPPEESPPLDDTLAVMVEMLERLLTPPDGGDSEAGKQVVRAFMARIRERMEAAALRDSQRTTTG
jgi:TetR/AcrR family acrAB operon transcriptional repressor